MRSALGLCLAALVVATGACATPDPGVRGVREFYLGRYDRAEEIFREAAATGDRRHAVLNLCRASSCALARGDHESALHDLREANLSMEDLSASVGEQAGAILGAEARKVWKGEAHERSLVAYYAGLCFLRRGDTGNALAGFKNALFLDSDSEEAAYRSDVALYHMLAGRVRLRWGQDEQARKAFAEATRLAPENPHVGYEANRDANVVVIADLGIGPVRHATGPHGSVAAFRGSVYPERRARVTVDGTEAGTTALGVDVLFEATTRGGREIEGLLAGKALFKDLATVTGVVVMSQAEKWEQALLGAGLLVLGQATSARADTRCWETLPGEIHVWVGRVEPGREHAITVEFLGGDGRVVPGLRVYRARVRVREGREALLYVRAGPSSREPNPKDGEQE